MKNDKTIGYLIGKVGRGATYGVTLKTHVNNIIEPEFKQQFGECPCGRPHPLAGNAPESWQLVCLCEDKEPLTIVNV